jgi:hypothetical protein
MNITSQKLEDSLWVGLFDRDGYDKVNVTLCTKFQYLHQKMAGKGLRYENNILQENQS